MPNRPSYPWEARWDFPERPIEACWTTALRSSRGALWPLLADTSDVNQRLGLPSMEFEERNGRLLGRSGGRLFRQEWVESPWEWEGGKQLFAERIYRKGFAKSVRVGYLLSDHEGGTRLTVYFGWIPRSWWSRPILQWINRWLRSQYRRVLGELDDLAGKEVQELFHPAGSVSGHVNEGRLQEGIRDLRDNGFGLTDADRLASYIRNTPDQALFRIRPKKLAFEWGIESEDLLPLLLQATRSGLLRLCWDIMCPHCLGVRKEAKSLGELREFDRCDICDIDFRATKLESIEATFKVQPEIREVKEVFYCSAEPAKKPHIILQITLDPGETYETDQQLVSGRYRLRTAVSNRGKLPLEVVDHEGLQSVTWNVHDDCSESLVRLQARGTVRFRLNNPEDERVAVVLERVAEDPSALRPSELFSFQQFRDLFSEESIASGLNLEIGQQTLLFTDVVGSTQLYAELGDAKAFQAVHDHFVCLQEIIRSHRGAVVKTIGDAMMAGFLNPEDGLKAAAEIQETFRPAGDQPLSLRVAVHRGVCLAVRLDANIDYFGSAVNYAAKMLPLAGAGETIVSEEFYALPEIADRMQALGMSLEERSFCFPPEPPGEIQRVHVAIREGRDTLRADKGVLGNQTNVAFGKATNDE